MRTHLVLAALLACASADAAPLADRLPAGAGALLEADLAALRGSPLIDRAAWNAAKGPEILQRAGIAFRKDVDRLAVGVFAPAADGKPSDVVALLSGRFDPAAVRTKLSASGARSGKLGDVAVQRMTGGTSLQLHPGMPSMELDADELLVSFLGDLLVVGTERGTRMAHGPKAGVPSPALAAARGAVPSSAAVWLAVDMASASASGSALPMDGLRSLTAWATLGDSLQLQAKGLATDANKATQVAGLVSMLAGFAAQAPEGRLLSALQVQASGEAVNAGLTLTAAQLREMARPAAPPAKATGT